MLLPLRRARQVALDRAIAGRRLYHLIPHLNSFVVRLNLLGPGVVWSEAFENRCDGHTAHSELAGAIEKRASVDVTMLVFMKKI
jgi:hypothetical protein